VLTVAIVGGAGQVGRELLRTLHTAPETRAFGVTRNAMAAAPLLADGLDIRVGSVTESAASLLQGADVVINAALEIDRPKRARLRNEALVESILTHARAALVVHFSTVAVYGSCVDAGFSTFERPHPDSTYGREKLRLERFAMAAARRARQPLNVVRLGHVYGPGQGISREVFDVVETGQWALPFGGELPSNAVHVHRLARAVPGLAAAARGERILNGFDGPQRTWRTLYDMHADAAGRSPALSMPPDLSRDRRAAFRRASRSGLTGRLSRQVYQWTRQLPLRSLVGVTAVRQTTEAALLALPLWVEGLIDRRYLVFSAAQNLESGATAGPAGPPPWYYSDAIPGPSLPEEPSTPEQRAREVAELRAWYQTWARPAWRVPASARTA
jgi:nucleoside-diphosphate-sugar epimerase